MAHLWVRIRRYGRLAKRLTDDAQFDCLYEYYLHKQIAGQKPPLKHKEHSAASPPASPA